MEAISLHQPTHGNYHRHIGRQAERLTCRLFGDRSEPLAVNAVTHHQYLILVHAEGAHELLELVGDRKYPHRAVERLPDARASRRISRLRHFRTAQGNRDGYIQPPAEQCRLIAIWIGEVRIENVHSPFAAQTPQHGITPHGHEQAVQGSAHPRKREKPRSENFDALLYLVCARRRPELGPKAPNQSLQREPRARRHDGDRQFFPTRNMRSRINTPALGWAACGNKVENTTRRGRTSSMCYTPGQRFIY